MEFSEDEKLSRRQDFALEQSIINFRNEQMNSVLFEAIRLQMSEFYNIIEPNAQSYWVNCREYCDGHTTNEMNTNWKRAEMRHVLT